MFAAVSNRSVVWLAVLVVAFPLVRTVACAQSPAATPPQAGTQDAPTPAAGALPPRYNPGEMLKDLANPVVAEVDGHPITLAEVGDAIRGLPPGMRDMAFEDLYPGVLDRLIQEQALVAKARRIGLDMDPVVKRHMQEVADRVLENELLNRLIGADITEAALLARYQRDYADKPGPEEVDVRVIQLSTEDQARKVIAELGGGADFATVARRESTDASATQGGSLGFLRQDKLTPELGAAAFLLEPGKISPNPVHSGAGWFVLKVEARRRVAQPGFAELREQIRHQLLREGVTPVAQDALAAATVHRFNMNGSEIVAPDGEGRDAAGRSR